MIATVQFVEQTYKKFNDLCFEGSLPEIPVYLSKARTFLGKTEYKIRRGLFGTISGYKDLKLRISTYYDLDRNGLEDVVLHEMIHCYILINNLKDTSSHGKLFRSIMAGINKDFARNVTVRHKIDAKDVVNISPKTELRHICVSRLQNGKTGITVCSEDRIPEITRSLKIRYRILELNWFTSDDPFFGSYPKSHKAVIYKISKEELAGHGIG